MVSQRSTQDYFCPLLLVSFPAMVVHIFLLSVLMRDQKFLIPVQVQHYFDISSSTLSFWVYVGELYLVNQGDYLWFVKHICLWFFQHFLVISSVRYHKKIKCTDNNSLRISLPTKGVDLHFLLTHFYTEYWPTIIFQSSCQGITSFDRNQPGQPL